MDKKTFRGLIWFMIVLIILFIFLIWLVFYKKFYFEASKISNNTLTTTTRTTTTEKKKTLSDEEIEKYLSYVPLSYVYNEDAYSGNMISLDNINERILMEQVYYKTTKVDGKIEMQHEMCGDMQLCETDDYVLVEDFLKVAKSMYNYKKFDTESFKIAGGSVKKSEIYYGAFYGMGAVELEKINFVEKYDIIENKLVIYEKVGLLENNIGEVNVYKYHGYNTYYKSVNTTEMNQEEYDLVVDGLKSEIEENDEFPIYKHIFKQHEDGTYYWFSTEVEENN